MPSWGYMKNPEQIEFKDQKRETMIELIDILDEGETAEEYLHTEEILTESMVMIEKNIFRTFSNKSKFIFISISRVINFLLTYCYILDNKKH